MKNHWKAKNAIIFFSIFFFLMRTDLALAGEDPTRMLEKVTQRVIMKLKSSGQKIQYEADEIYNFIEKEILPHLDFVEMGRWVVGRNAWREADKATRKAFIDEFKIFLIKNYTKLLLKFTNEEIEFFPLREDIKNQGEIQVSSIIKKPGRSPIRMDYQLISLDGVWKVYDILIEEVSLLEGYRAQFSDDIREGGVAAAIEAMRRYNAR